jgi:hypothetical protein
MSRRPNMGRVTRLNLVEKVARLNLVEKVAKLMRNRELCVSQTRNMNPEWLFS